MPVKRIASAISDTGIVELRVSIQRLIILCFMTGIGAIYTVTINLKPTIQFGSSLICVKNGAEKIVKRKV